jgi:hypothetical protein
MPQLTLPNCASPRRVRWRSYCTKAMPCSIRSHPPPAVVIRAYIDAESGSQVVPEPVRVIGRPIGSAIIIPLRRWQGRGR